MDRLKQLKQESITRWVKKADHDLITAHCMLNRTEPITDVVCFHAQQCAEKYLKAFLVHAETHIEKTHYLPRLVELCSIIDPSFDALSNIAIELTDYAVVDRYPDHWREIPVTEAAEAITKADAVKNFVMNKLKSKGMC